MTQVKPICVIYYLPELFGAGGYDNGIVEINQMMEQKMPDYHVFAIPSTLSADGSCDDVRFKVFHPKDFTTIQYQELKDLIMAEIEKITQKD